jgi:glycosyltransferase involved in cell wall biosynthesis
MKILIVTQTVDIHDPILGFFHSWIAEFSKHFEKVTVICLKKGDYTLPNNVRVFSLGKEKGRSKLSYIKNFYSYIWGMRKDYDKVFIHMNPIYVILGGCIWITLRKGMALWYTHKNVDLKLRLATLLTNRVYTASKESFKLRSKKVRVLGHGINTESMSFSEKIPGEVFVISTIGRVSPTKNVHLLLEAFITTLKDADRSLRFEIVGEASLPHEKEYKKELEATIDRSGVRDLVIFKGAISNYKLGDYLATVDLTLNASLTGSLDKAVLESLACGVPALTSNPAFKEMLSPFGLFVPYDSAAFAVGLNRIIRSKIDPRQLRSIIEREHSLKSLISKIASDLENGLSKDKIKVLYP